MENHYQEKILEMLQKAECPMDVEKIRVQVGIGNWQTALKHCLELHIAGKIRGQKTSKSWVFWINKNEVTTSMAEGEKKAPSAR